MEMNQYLNESKCTDIKNIDPCYTRIDREMTHLLHGSIGIATESGEILDAIKKHIYYGKPLDKVNLKEEIGDVLWYCALLLRNLDSSFEEVAETNIKKLRARFGDKFSEFDAQNRDLETERAILEGRQ
jgi:NTP pyrophosphatase (non-canonical NTP hydrolase)